jgi:putative signal transducing protein
MQPEPDASHEMDMVTLFSSSNFDAEMEATGIHGVLEANGIESIIVGTSSLPVLEFEVQVSKDNLEEARRILAAAQAAGPAAAAEAEAASEE